jgi:phosphoesterase RecJ-like protein
MLVAEFLRRIGEPLDRDLAACLYTGLVTDTGRFQYSSTDPSAMELGGRLLETGIEHEELSRRIYETHPFGYLGLLSLVTGRVQLDEDTGLLSSYVTQDDLADHALEFEHTEPLVDVLRSVERARVALMLKQATDGTWRVSLRSKGEVDVGKLAASLGGGGHTFSAGFTTTAAREEVLASVRERLGP